MNESYASAALFIGVVALLFYATPIATYLLTGNSMIAPADHVIIWVVFLIMIAIIALGILVG